MHNGKAFLLVFLRSCQSPFDVLWQEAATCAFHLMSCEDASSSTKQEQGQTSQHLSLAELLLIIMGSFSERRVRWVQDSGRGKAAAIRAVWASGKLNVTTVRGHGYWTTNQPGRPLFLELVKNNLSGL